VKGSVRKRNNAIPRRHVTRPWKLTPKFPPRPESLPNQRQGAGKMLTQVPKEPWATLCANFVGPLPRSEHGNRMDLVLMDWFLKWTLQKAFRERIVARFGVPKVIITYNGIAGTWCEKNERNLRGGETKSGKGSLGPSQALQPATKTMDSEDLSKAAEGLAAKFEAWNDGPYQVLVFTCDLQN